MRNKKKAKKRKVRGDTIGEMLSQDQISLLLAHYQAGSFADAEELAVLLTRRFPSHPFAWKVLGAVLKQTGRVAESLLPMQKSVELSPLDAEAHTNLGVTLKELGRTNEAETSHRQAIALHPDHAAAHNNLGVALQELVRLEEAELSYRKAIALKPDYAEAHYNLGNALTDLHRLDESELSYKQAIAQMPDFAEAHYNLGNTLKELGRRNEAKSSYQQAIALKPDYAEPHCNLGNALQEEGALEAAESSYKTAIALKADYAEAHYNLGNTLKKLGRLLESESCYKNAIALKPDYADAHNNLGITLKELGRLNESEASYKQAIALKPDFAEAHSNLGTTLMELGKLNEAAGHFTTALAHKPADLTAKHLVDALSGKTTQAAPLAYVERLFDGYAPKFDATLVETLGYTTPKLIAEMILKDRNSVSLGSIIDLGCGTGLLGSEVKPFCRYIEGLDLSQKMLDEAKKKSIYDRLVKQDILGYLANAKLNFDYFIATDVFIYVGDLADVFHLIKSRNKTRGKLVFSTENCDGDGFFLEKTGRYSHSKVYIDSLCKKFGYQLCHFEIQPLRKEQNQYVSGGLYILDF